MGVFYVPYLLILLYFIFMKDLGPFSFFIPLNIFRVGKVKRKKWMVDKHKREELLSRKIGI